MANEKELAYQDKTSQVVGNSSAMDTVKTKLKDSITSDVDDDDDYKQKNAFLSVTQITDLVEDLCSKSYVQSERPHDAAATVTATVLKENNVESLEETRPMLQAPAQNTSFSFKHFLNKSAANTSAATTTVCSSAATTLDSCNSDAFCAASTSSASKDKASCLQTSTGARPKVPSLTSYNTTSSLSVGSSESCLPTSNSMEKNMGSTSKMKRSPRFSSFDSQASLVEYAYTDNGPNISINSARVPDKFAGYKDVINDSHDIFSANFPLSLNTQNAESCDFDGQHFRRSLSNYEMPLSSVSPRRRIAVTAASKENRPNRLPLNMNVSKFKLDVLIDATANNTSNSRTMTANEQHAAASSAALPDFVQDHWMDTWYAHDMSRNSLQNSPIVCDVLEDIATDQNLAANNNAAVAAAAAEATEPVTVANSKMLPDFLSDGPIIHSSQRLADVALGLPAISVGSPEHQSIVSQLSQIRLENERLQRELDEVHIALNEQTIRANSLERQLQESIESRDARQAEEKTRKQRRYTTATEKQQISEMKQRVDLLTAETEALRRENEELRALGAIGGCNNKPRYDRSFKSTITGTCENNAATASRATKTCTLSRDLRIAAANAESNLKQLLIGVENLRQMAADIENSETRCDFTNSPDLYSDFPDECDSSLDFLCGPEL